MATLYVENIPDGLYEALRKRARENRKSIAAEVISLLERHIPTAEELQRRKRFYERMSEIRTAQSGSLGRFPNAEDMIREDRDR